MSEAQQQIDAQMAVLNNTFAGGEGGSNTGVGFTLAGVDRYRNAPRGARR